MNEDRRLTYDDVLHVVRADGQVVESLSPDPLDHEAIITFYKVLRKHLA